MSSSVDQVVRAYILEEVLAGEDPSQLQDDTPLISSGVLDSITTLKLVAFLEQRFSISIAAHEANAEYLDTIRQMVDLVNAKRG